MTRHLTNAISLAAAVAAAAWLLAVRPASAQPVVSPDFELEVHASGLSYITSLAFDADGVLHAGQADVIFGVGRVFRVEDLDEDGTAETITPLPVGDLGQVTGVTFRGLGFPIEPAPPRSAASARSAASVLTPDIERVRRGDFLGEALDLFVSHYRPGVEGTISTLRDEDGDGLAEARTDVVTGLPSDGLNGNQQIAVGFDGALYFGQGGRTNAGIPRPGMPADTPLNGTVLRVEADGSDLQPHATGLRTVFDLAFLPSGDLLATENGPDPEGPIPVGVRDELNAIVAGGDYGWPEHVEFPEAGTGTIGPVALFGASSSTDGVALVPPGTFCGLEGDLIAAQFGSFSDPTVPRRLVRVDLIGPRAAQVEIFASGFGRPLDVAFGPDGALYVADFADFAFTPGSSVIYRIVPKDTDADGVADICEP